MLECNKPAPKEKKSLTTKQAKEILSEMFKDYGNCSYGLTGVQYEMIQIKSFIFTKCDNNM